MKFSRLIAAIVAALALSACIGGAIIPVPLASGPQSSYNELYYYPESTTYYHRHP